MLLADAVQSSIALAQGGLTVVLSDLADAHPEMTDPNDDTDDDIHRQLTSAAGYLDTYEGRCGRAAFLAIRDAGTSYNRPDVACRQVHTFCFALSRQEGLLGRCAMLTTG